MRSRNELNTPGSERVENKKHKKATKFLSGIASETDDGFAN